MTRYELLKKLEWAGPRVPGYYDNCTCLVCGQSREFGHAPDCALDAALKRKVVEVEIPEPEDGSCHNCHMFLLCELCSRHKKRDLWTPGPGCPWYSKKGDEDGNAKG